MEVDHDGMVVLIHRGMVVLRRATLDQVAGKLAEEGVDTATMVED